MDRRKIKHMAMIDLIGALCLDRELSDEEFEIVRSYSRCMDWRVRMAVAENLGIVHTSERTVKLLKKLARDRNEMVTIQAVKSLGARGDESCAELLGSKLGSRSYITRGYAGLALAEHMSVPTSSKTNSRRSSTSVRMPRSPAWNSSTSAAPVRSSPTARIRRLPRWSMSSHLPMPRARLLRYETVAKISSMIIWLGIRSSCLILISSSSAA